MTIKGPEGRMTKPLATPFNVGDVVELIAKQTCGCSSERHVGKNGLYHPRVGEVGVLRRIIVSAPEDGDETFLVFGVRFAEWGKTWWLAGSEFALIAKNETVNAQAVRAEDDAWLRRQLDDLGGGQ